MDAKDFLKQVRRLDVLINNKQSEIDQLRSKAYYTNSNNLQNLVAKIVDYENGLNKDIDLLIDKKKEVASVIDKLKDATMIDMLYRRYFQFQIWEKIALEMGYTYQALHKIHARALKEIQNILRGMNGKE